MVPFSIPNIDPIWLELQSRHITLATTDVSTVVGYNYPWLGVVALEWSGGDGGGGDNLGSSSSLTAVLLVLPMSALSWHDTLLK